MGPDLYALLGLSRDAEPELLRRTYEQHIAAATNAHNFRRAAELSAAFDGLDPYAKSRAYSGRGIGERNAPVQRNQADPRMRRAREPRAERRIRYIAYAALAVCLMAVGFLGVATFLQNRDMKSGVSPHKAPPPTSQATATIPRPQARTGTWVPLQMKNAQAWTHIPLTAWVGPDGAAQVSCPYPSGQRVIRMAELGQAFICPYGGQPYLRTG